MTRRDSGLGAAVAIGIFAVALALYTVTLNTDVQPADSGELQLAAVTLGIPHPPGFPLFTLIGWLFSLAPLGSPFARVSYVSVVACALALVLVYAAVRAIAGPGRMGVAAGALAAAALGTSTTFWSQATTTNIRSLTLFFAAAMTLAALRVWHQRDNVVARPRWVIAFAAALGFGVGHHASLAFIGVMLLAVVAARALQDERNGRRLLRAASRAVAVVVAAQVVWLYLPLRNGAPSRLAHGDLATLQGLIDHALARGFAGDLFYFISTEPARLADRLGLAPDLTVFQFGAAVSLAAATAWAVLLWRRPALGLALSAAVLAHLFVTLTYRAPQTVEYALPAWLLIAVGLGGGLALAAEPIRGWLDARSRRSGLALRGMLLTGLALLVAREAAGRFGSYVALSQDDGARTRAIDTLNAASPDGVILAQWHHATPMWAVQEIEGYATGVRVEYVNPEGAQKYEDTFAERVRAEVSAGRRAFVTTVFSPQFAARDVCLDAPQTATVWSASDCDVARLPSAAQVMFDQRIAVIPPFGLQRTAESGAAVIVPARWRADGPVREGESLTFRVFRPDGRLAANADVRLDPSIPQGREQFAPLVIGLPVDLDPGAYMLVVGAYRQTPSGFEPLSGATSRGATMEYAPLAELAVTPPSQPPATSRPVGSPSAGNLDQPQLLGVDYDTGIAGQLRVYTHWVLGAAAQDLSLLGQDGGELGRRSLPANPRFDEARLAYFTAVFDAPAQRGLRVKFGSSLTSGPLPDPAEGERFVPYANRMVLTGIAARRAGAALNLDLEWLAARPLIDDLKVSARVEGGGLFAQHDGTPALGAVPTLKWIRASKVRDRHPLDIGANDGALRVDVRVYDNLTQLPLPMADERYEQRQTPLFIVNGR